MDPRDALELVLAEARGAGADQADAQWEESESFSLDVFEGKVKNIERSDSNSLGLRVLVDGRPGYASTERATLEALKRCARDAVALARYTDRTAIRLPDPVEIPPQDLGVWNSDSCEVGPDRLIGWCLEAESSALEADPRVTNVPHLGASRSAGRILLANSLGFFGERRSSSVGLGVGVVASSGGVDKMGWDGISWRDPARMDPVGIARKAAERSTELLGAGPVAPGALPVLFDERVSAHFLSIFLGAFNADAVQKGQSRLVGRTGERLAPVGFHLSTQPLLPGMAGSRRFDGEGVPARPRRLVEDGVLLGFLHNLETASREGIPSSGDATRSSSGRVGAGFSNLVVETSGGVPKQELESRHPRMLHVVKLEGSTGCNPVSGEISVGVQGFLVENGLRKPVDRVSLSGNFFDLLPELSGWGDGYRPGIQSQFVPALLFPSLRLAS